MMTLYIGPSGWHVTQEQINALVHIGIQLLQLINMRITAGTFDSVQTSMIVHTSVQTSMIVHTSVQTSMIVHTSVQTSMIVHTSE